MKPRKKRFWYPVSDGKAFDPGDLIYVDHGESKGWNEVRSRGRNELLLQRVPWWDLMVRRWKAWWAGIMKSGP